MRSDQPQLGHLEEGSMMLKDPKTLDDSGNISENVSVTGCMFTPSKPASTVTPAATLGLYYWIAFF